MIGNLLVGYDASEAAVRALTFAAGLARTFSSSMHVLAEKSPATIRRLAPPMASRQRHPRYLMWLLRWLMPIPGRTSRG